MSPAEYGQSILFGGLMGGTVNGGIAAFNGKSIINGLPKPSPSGLGPVSTPQLNYNAPKLDGDEFLNQRIPGFKADEIVGDLRLPPTKPENLILTPKDGLVPYYPPNNGFSQQAVQTTLRPGQFLDRIGGDGGRYLSPQGTPIPMRALPPGSGTSLNTYEVLKPLPVQSGFAAPAFGQPGGGTQYLAPVSIKELIRLGYLRLIP